MMEESKQPKTEEPSYLRAYLAVITTSLLHLSTGAVMGWSSPMMSQLVLDSTEKTLVGSLYSLGAAPGPFIVTFCLDTIGRKGTVYVLSSFFVISWILLLSTKEVMVIYIARLIGGIGVGGCCSGLPILVSEMALTEIRGRLGSLSFSFISIGSLLVFSLGPFIGYVGTSIFGLLIALVFLVLFFFVPESPYYYIRKGRKMEAQEVLKKLRGYTTKEANADIDEIERTINQNVGQDDISFWQSMKTRQAKKGIAIGIFLVLLQQSTGANPINTYCQTIFEHANLNFSAAIVPVIIIFSSLFSFLAVILVNRCLTVKLALVISSTGCAIFLGLFGLYFLLIENDILTNRNYSFISVLVLFIANIMVGLGAGPLVWPLVAEILPPTVKGIGTGICGFISSFFGFVIIALFSTISDAYGYSTSIFGLAVLMTGMAIATTFIVPDTTGKSLMEIQELLAK